MKTLRILTISSLISHISYLSLAISFPPGGNMTSSVNSPLPLPPFTFVGRVTDYDHVAYDGDQLAEVRAYTVDGKGARTLIAKSSTFSSTASAYNFRLDIPVATAASEGFVAPQTKIVLEFVDDEGRIFNGVVPEDDAIVGEPGGSKKIFTMLAEDADQNGIADEKEWYYYNYALAMNIWLTEFDADADYDGDGQSNRDEYIAGTNPFIAADVFNVRTLNVDFWPKDDGGTQLYDWVKVGFFANNGRCYTLVTSPSLDDGNQWTLGIFKYQPFESEPSYSRLLTDGEEAGWRWFYIPKDVSRRFWRIEVE